MTRHPAGARGFTLIEMLVVLALLGLAAMVVAPALLRSGDAAAPDALSALLPRARALSASRGETMYLRIAESGDWRIEGAASSDEPPVETGKVAPFAGLPLTLIVAATGTCGFDAWSAASAAAASVRLDPLACEITAS